MAKRRQARSELARVVIDRYPEDAAQVLESSPLQESVAFIETLSPHRATEVLGRVSIHLAASIIPRVRSESAAALLTEFDAHRAAALLARLDQDDRDRILGRVDPAIAEDLKTLMEYPDDSAGGLMDADVTGFRPDMTVAEVIEQLAELRHKRIQDLFMIDPDGRLIGAVAIQDVVFADRGDRLESLVRGPSPRVQVTAPRDEVLELLERHRMSSLPVVDFAGRLLGVLRQEELIETAQEQAAADMMKMVGASEDERALSSPWFAVRKRLPWLEINLLTAFLAASVVGLFENTIARFTTLAVLLPVVAGQSGNTGAQALAVTMRGLALREIRLRHWWRVTGKEVMTGALNGLLVALTTSIAVYVWSRSWGLALVIGLSMILSMTAAGLAGAAIPMALTALRQDPAQSSSVVLTTVTDVVGFFSFLGIATLLSGML